MFRDNTDDLSAHAEVLIWQNRLRITAAIVATVAGLAMLNVSSDSDRTAYKIPLILAAAAGYMTIVAGIATIARRIGRVPGWLVAVTMLSDVALIFALTVSISPPQYHDRILIFAFFALHLTTFYFGRRYAGPVVALTAIGYAWLVEMRIRGGSALIRSEEVLSVGGFVFASIVLLVEHGNLRNRLASIVHLFGRAEEGDFSAAYDEQHDTRPDAITRVGRAYNRVRGQLASMVLTDPLTGCLNRRGFDQALSREVARAGRAGSEIALLAVDIDHFKRVNDSFGHLTGDAVLREIGLLLLRAARAGDVVARTGGEEFSLVLPDTSAAGAYQLASRLCEGVRAHAFGEGTGGPQLTVSVGVVASDIGRLSNAAETLTARADEALYCAKRGGRDRVRVWAPTDQPGVALPV